MAAITITSENDRTVTYAIGGTPSTGPFTVDFPYFFVTELVVTKIKAGVQTTLVLSTDYSHTGVAADDGFSSGSISLLSADSNCTITISSNLATTKATNFPANGPLSIPTLNTLFSRLFSWCQDLRRKYGSSLHYPAGEESLGSQLSPATVRALKYLTFDENGNVATVNAIGSWKSTWATATSYVWGDLVIDGAAGADTKNIYLCKTAHTSGTWSTDLAAAKWVLVFDAATVNAAAAASASAAATSASAAATSATAAASSATAAAGSATTATTQASTATTQASNASASATSAATSATNAASSASAAASSASAASSSATAAASAVAAFTGTATDNRTPAVASISFTTQSGKSWSVGTRLRATSDSNSAVWMEGVVTSYSGTALTISADVIGTATAKADWTIQVTGDRGATGATGSTGAAGQGVPVGGAASSILAKLSGTDYDTGWIAAAPVRQIVSSFSSAVATGTTQIPVDDTIPQNTEGDQYLSVSIAPKSATSKLLFLVPFNLSLGAANFATVALFQDSTANALASVNGLAANVSGAATYPFELVLMHVMTSGTTSSTTFKVRAGPSGADTLTFNGQSGARKMGGTMSSGIIILEIGG